MKILSNYKDNADIDFMTTLYEQYADSMKRVAKYYGPDSQVEDIVQEAFLHLLDHIDTLRKKDIYVWSQPTPVHCI